MESIEDIAPNEVAAIYGAARRPELIAHGTEAVCGRYKASLDLAQRGIPGPDDQYVQV